MISEEEVRKMVAREIEGVRGKISDIVDETSNYAIEKTERAMERVTNEKIMAVNEYSDTVLEEINKNHKEVVFLYDMLNDKHDNLMSTINEATQAADGIKQTVKDAEITANEAAQKVKSAQDTANEAVEIAREAAASANEAVEMSKEATDAAGAAVENVKQAENTARETRETVRNAMQSVMEVVSRKADLEALHNAQPYHEDVVEEVRSLMQNESDTDAGTAQIMSAAREETMPQMTQHVSAAQQSVQGARTQQPAQTPQAVQEQQTGRVQQPDAGNLPSEASQPDMMPHEEAVIEPPAEEPAEFTPIAPRRVEIIHQPDGDYVAEGQDLSTSAAFAQMGIFAPKREENEEPKRKPRAKRASRKESAAEDGYGVDLQFAKGKENSRNSNERILELHKAGKSNMAIAKELGLGLGEVKLVIDLFEGM